jgi:hypothetical protein
MFAHCERMEDVSAYKSYRSARTYRAREPWLINLNTISILLDAAYRNLTETLIARY